MSTARPKSESESVEQDVRHFCREAVSAGHWKSEKRLRTYLGYLFRDVPLWGRSFLDVGGGVGLFCAAAKVHGAARAVCLEPGGAGALDSIKAVAATGHAADARWGIEFVSSTLEDYHRNRLPTDAFDVILLHNVINHLDEAACSQLHADEHAREVFRRKIRLIGDLAALGARLIVCDCARNNFLPDLRLKNPLQPWIEWHKHQNPRLWRRLFEECGWRHQSTRWTTPNFLGHPGRLLGNALCSYFLLGHFRLVFAKHTEETTRCS